MNIICKLLSKQLGEPLDGNGSPLPIRRTFAWWRDAFEEIMSSAVWTMKSNSEQKSEEQKPVLTGEKSFIKRSGARSRVPIPTAVTSSSDESFCRKSSGRRTRKKASSSGSEEEKSLLLQALRDLGRRKEVLAPVPFNTSSTDSLSKFLKAYEKYFDSRYDGTEKEKASHLEGYLEGSAKAAFRALNGKNIKFSVLKQKLITWYESQLVDSRDNTRRCFLNAAMSSDDTCGIYCLRLEQLAAKAFRDSPSELEHQLKKKFRETSPRALILQIDNAENIFSVTSDEPLSWKQWKRLADTIGRRPW